MPEIEQIRGAIDSELSIRTVCAQGSRLRGGRRLGLFLRDLLRVRVLRAEPPTAQ